MMDAELCLKIARLRGEIDTKNCPAGTPEISIPYYARSMELAMPLLEDIVRANVIIMFDDPDNIARTVCEKWIDIQPVQLND